MSYLYSGVLSYLHSYASNFDLEKHISYNSDVTLVEPAADYDSTGRWKVGVKNINTGEVKTGTFDAVLVCNGLNNQHNRPDITGLSSFKGQVINPQQHDATDYDGKRLVVIGLGNTGCEVAVEASRKASKVSQWLRVHVRQSFYIIMRRLTKTVQLKFSIAKKNEIYCQLLFDTKSY